MIEDKQIKTIKGSFESKLKEKGSVFIGKSFAVNNTEETESILASIKKEYYDATHHCYAFKFQNGIFKYSDDGEPNGTAGIRILNAIEHFELNNVLVCVIRYFGGVKLGVGPLGKAYYNSAFKVIENSHLITLNPYKKILISADFSLTSQVYRILSNHKAIIKNTTYDTKINLECLSHENEIEDISDELKELSKGKIIFSVLDKIFFI